MTEHILFDSKKFIFFSDVPRLDATSAIIRTSNLIKKLAFKKKKIMPTYKLLNSITKYQIRFNPTQLNLKGVKLNSAQ